MKTRVVLAGRKTDMIWKDSGVTIIEVMVVTAVIAILCAIAVPNYIGWLPKYRLSTSARNVLSDLEYARGAAIKANASVVVAFNIVSNFYTLWVDNGALGNKDNWTQDGDEGTLRYRETPSDVSISAADFNGSTLIRFTGSGLPETPGPVLGGGTVTLANRYDSKVVLLSVGGKTRIQ